MTRDASGRRDPAGGQLRGAGGGSGAGGPVGLLLRPVREAGQRLLDPDVRREARGELPLLACLLAVVALLTLITAAGPPLLDRWAGDALKARFTAAARLDPIIRQSVVLHAVDIGDPQPQPDPARSTLGDDLGTVTKELLSGAKPPLSGLLRHESARVEVPVAATQLNGARVNLGLLWADDAPARASYVQGAPPGRPTMTSPLPVAFSTTVRDQFHLRLGQRFSLSPNVAKYHSDAVVTGFFAAPAATDAAPLWHDEPLLVHPTPGAKAWQAQAVVDAASLTAVQDAVRGERDLVIVWRSTLRMSGPDAAGLATPGGLLRLRNAAADFDLATADAYCPQAMGGYDSGCLIGQTEVTQQDASQVTTNDTIPQVLTPFATARAQARTLESFAIAGLLAVGLATVVVTARLAVHRRAAAQAMQRARGASPTDLAVVRLAQTAPAALLGLLVGYGAALLAVPAGSGLGSPLPAVAPAAVAWLTLPALTLVAARDRGRRGERPPAARRLMIEGAVLLLAVAGVLALRARGTGQGGLDVRLAVVPALLGVATVILLIRVYPLPVRLLSRAAAGRRGTIALIALSRAAREASGQALALLVLVTTLSTAVFGGMVSRTLADGSRDAAEWSTGADASVIGAGKAGTPEGDLAALPGVDRALAVRSAVSELTSTTDGARYSIMRIAGLDAKALHTSVPDSPAARSLIAAGLAGRPRPTAAGGHYVLPVLATADFATGHIGETFGSNLLSGRVSFRIVGLLDDSARRDPALGPLLSTGQHDAGRGEAADSSTALAANSPLVLADASALSVLPQHDIDNSAVLLYGRHVQAGAVRAVGAAVAGPTGEVRIRSEALAAADQDGLLHGVRKTFATSTALAVLLALLALVLELLLSARDRGRTASRLRTLGLPTRGIAALNMLELLPMVLAAVAGGLALGLALPGILGPTLTLREFTGGPAAPAARTDYLLTAGLGFGLAALVAAAVATETWAGRRRGLGTVLRLGDTV
ncbi:FtsX-like permease family protein [Streptomyces sp. CA-111067]|uniref:FtsX-like permease family protein n=1 Tax=Streptomyces sp. CA-111067 TaxID=3240046 RepID=UPI003D98A110